MLYEADISTTINTLVGSAAGISTEVLAEDALNLTAQVDALAMIVIRDTVEASALFNTQGTLHGMASDEVLTRSLLSLPYFIQALDALNAADTLEIDAFKLATVFSVVHADADLDTQAAFNVTLAAAITLMDKADNVLNLTLEDAIQALGEASGALKTNLDALDELNSVVGAEANGIFFLDVEDNGVLEDEVDSVGHLMATVEDGLAAYVSVKIGEETIQGWVMNTKNSAFSEYQNFPFNSLARLDGRYYGVAEDGLYELTGDDDEGEPIEALIRTGLMDFGSHFLKDAKAAYIGYTSSGKLVLKVVTTDQGAKQEWWFEMKQSEASSMRDGRFTIGRGLRAKYWQLELVNAAGADFEVDDVQLLYSVLSRRIR